MSSTILVERDGDIVVLKLNRPDKLNALNLELVTTLRDTFRQLASDKSVRAAVLTGSGEKAFAAGADIEAMSRMTATEGGAFGELGHEALALVERAHFPVIGAINGFALGGGCELALACDFLYASDKAKFGQPEVNLGIIPGFGGTQRLARRVGIGRARELCFTGDIIGADEALRIGLVNAIHPHADLFGKALDTARKIASKGPLAVAAAKRVILRGEGASLETANELEARAFGALFGSADQREGMTAFIEKRKATFTGS